MTMRIIILLASLLLGCQALTDSEAAKFTNDGSYEGFVRVSATSDGNWLLSSNGLPDHHTQTVNPNTASAQNYVYKLARNPIILSAPTCTSLGPVGFTVNGVPLFNPLTNEEENAVEGSQRERFDSCDGHSAQRGDYHYHQLPDSCVHEKTVDELIGVALDGVPIYGPLVSDKSAELTTADLDECHGRYVNGQYRYHMTKQFPYIIGCFKGQVLSTRASTQTCTSVQQGGLCHCTREGSIKSLGYDYSQGQIVTLTGVVSSSTTTTTTTTTTPTSTTTKQSTPSSTSTTTTTTTTAPSTTSTTRSSTTSTPTPTTRSSTTSTPTPTTRSTPSTRSSTTTSTSAPGPAPGPARPPGRRPSQYRPNGMRPRPRF